MYPPGQEQPATGINAGDRVEHRLLPGYLMRVKDIAPCEMDSARPQAHSKYNVRDPAGNRYWVCACDVRKVG